MSNLNNLPAGVPTTFPSLNGATGATSNTQVGVNLAVLIELRVCSRLLFEIARGSAALDELTIMREDEALNISTTGAAIAS